MQFEAKVIWHQAHEQDGKVVLWQTKLYGSHEGHGVALEVATAEETFDRTGTYLVTINAVGESVPELRNPVAMIDAIGTAQARTFKRPTLKAKAPKKTAAKKR